MLTALLKGRCEALADRQDQFVDVLRGKVHHEGVLLHFTEVEQLIDKFQQSVGIAVNHLHVVGGVTFLHDLLQRADDERHRGAYLVGNHREEVQTGIAHLFLFLCIQPLYLLLVLPLGQFQTEMDVLPDDRTQQQEV